jgi:hypothetical protein
VIATKAVSQRRIRTRSHDAPREPLNLADLAPAVVLPRITLPERQYPLALPRQVR